MKNITAEQIENLKIKPEKCVEWVTQSFSLKYECQLPAKISVHPVGNDFFTTMPCLLPFSIARFGVKVVSRVLGRVPALKSDLLLYDSKSGDLLALMNSDWITAMRTGAVVSLAIKIFRQTRAKKYSFIGLGSTARAALLCLLSSSLEENFEICLFRYKDQAEKMISLFSNFSNATFKIVDTIPELVKDADVFVSCITDAQGLLIEDESLFKPGVLIIPVHTRGFQNCDLFFDKVFADDTDHVKGFKNFSRFRSFNEISNVLLGKCPGRENDKERILSYNIGLGLHDVYFASNIFDIIECE